MSIDLMILIAAILVSWLIFTWLVTVLKATVKTAVLVALLVLGLQLIFGIGMTDLWTPVQEFFSQTWEKGADILSPFFGD
jgi:Zn-dependent protease with chaperone function